MANSVGWRRLRACLAEPLVQFLLIGCVIFSVYRVMQPEVTAPNLIEVTQADLDIVVETFRRSWKREPTTDELGRLVEDLVRDEVLYREAMALGLDRGDIVVRQRLRQKIEFLTGAGIALDPPPEAELRAWHVANQDRFTPPARIEFIQVMLDGSGEVDRVRAALQKGANPETLGRSNLLPSRMVGDAAAIDASFGQGFFLAIADLTPGEWSGPVNSAFGSHLVLINRITKPPADFDAMRFEIEAAWMQEERLRRQQEIYATMRADYIIRLPSGGAE